MQKKKMAHVIAITDSVFGPVASISDNKLIVKNNMMSFVDSLVPALSIVNALVVSISEEKRKYKITL